MDLRAVRESEVARVAVLVLASSFLLTAAFYGVVAVAAGGVPGVTARLPYYVVAGAVAFVVAMFVLEDPGRSGVPIFTTTLGLGVAGFLLVAFASEGVLYAVRNPGDVLASSLGLYFLAAALICTAVGYWSLHHWREFAEQS